MSGTTLDLDTFARLRRDEYARLDARGHAYLDYTGAALYARSQIEAHHARLLDDVLGNPHSGNPASLDATDRMERARARLLAFLRADPADWTVVFTANASAALRIVGESFPFTRGSRLLLTRDNHNSVHGMRSFARRAGADVAYIPLDASLRSHPPAPFLDEARPGVANLFAFPAQSNFSGVRHPLAWIDEAHARGWLVALDAAAFLPAAPLRLDRVAPDFLVLSFYKMFGFPTGIGALVARTEALASLVRPWFAGGAVDWVSTQHGTHALSTGAAGFEDGTAHFLAFDAVRDGLELLDAIGMANIAKHTASLTRRLVDGLGGLHHASGRPLVVLYGPGDTVGRGGTVAFNVLDDTGDVVTCDDIVAAAAARGVSVRGGCFCNPGAAESAFAFEPERTRACLETLGDAFTVPAFGACLGRPVGAVRASVGIPTTDGDVDRLIDVVRAFAI